MDTETLTWALVNGQKQPSVTLYPRGCIMHRPGRVSNPTGKGGGLRGRVATFSKSSRRRLRNLLLTREWAAGFVSYGVTFTVPGTIVTPEEYRKVWSVFSLDVVVAGHAMIWRAEVQGRGATHWHCIFGVRDGVAGDTVLPYLRSLWFSAVDRVLGRGDFQYRATSQWQNGDGTIRSVGMRLIEEETGTPPAVGEGLSRIPPAGEGADSVQRPQGSRAVTFTCTVGGALRSELPGAQTRAVDVQTGGDERGSWYRYLADHASKTKRGQVGRYIGRHWGVVGRAHLRMVPGSPSSDLSNDEYHRLTRAYARLCTPRRLKAGVPFGRKLGRRYGKARGVGNHAFFCRPATMSRLIAWASGDCPPVRHPEGF